MRENPNKIRDEKETITTDTNKIQNSISFILKIYPPLNWKTGKKWMSLQMHMAQQIKTRRDQQVKEINENQGD